MQDKNVYEKCENELKVARDDYTFKVRANDTFAKSVMSDHRVKGQMLLTNDAKNNLRSERKNLRGVGKQW